jgi:hypothetical protein
LLGSEGGDGSPWDPCHDLRKDPEFL